VFNEHSADQRARDGPNGPRQLRIAVVFRPLAQRDDVREDHKDHSNNAAAADALHGAAGEQLGEVLRDAADDRAEGEERQRGEQQLAPAEDVGEGGDGGLEGGAREQV